MTSARQIRLPGAVLAGLWLVAWFSLAATQGVAQSADLALWDNFASRAEKQISDKSTSSDDLIDLRDKLSDWRDRLIKASNANADRIATAKEQIAALGSPPAEGATEAPEIAARRKSLNDQLAELQAPGLAAVEARTLADARIASIDRILRERQTNVLLTLGPSPLNPASWAEAFEAVTQGSGALANETRARLTDGRFAQAMRANGPAVLLSLIAAVLAVWRGRGWIEAVANYLQRAASMRGRRVLAFLVSLGQIVVPVVGLYFLVTAVELASITGARGTALAVSLVSAGLSVFTAHWLGRRLFPRNQKDDALVPMADRSRRRARLLTTAMGFLVGLNQINQIVAFPTMGLPISTPPTAASDAVHSVISLPVIALAGLALFNLSRLLRAHALEAGAALRGDYVSRVRIIGLTAMLGMAVAITAPLLAIIGYLNAAEALIWPAILSLAVIGLIVLLQDFLGDIYASLVHEAEGARDALIPVLMGFALVVLSLPVFALIWGVPAAQLGDLWLRFREGLSIGGIRISPSGILTFAVIFAIGYMLTRALQGTMRNTLLPKTRIDKGAQNAIVSGMGYIGIFLAALVAITSAGINLSSLAIVAGALSVGIGFGLQNIVSNFVSGIILLIERPITEGDWIEVGGQQGYVRAISVRSTLIETFDRTDVIVPNADFVSGQVINYTRGNSIGRLILPVGVAYGSNTRRIHDILTEIAENHPIVMLNPPPAVLFMGFGASSLDFEVRVILSDINQVLSVRSELNHQIAERFAEEGIEIPFPQQDLWLRNPEVISQSAARGPVGPMPVPESRGDTLVRGEAADADGGGGEA